MAFRKVTLSLPVSLYNEGMALVESGLFSNFSDLVRAGIRQEYKEFRQMAQDFDEKMIYDDKRLIAGVEQSVREAKAGKGRVINSGKELDEYFSEL